MSGSKVAELDPRPARELTSREIAKMLGGAIGSLLGFCREEAVRDAVRWLAETDAFWDIVRVAQPAIVAAVTSSYEEQQREGGAS